MRDLPVSISEEEPPADSGLGLGTVPQRDESDDDMDDSDLQGKLTSALKMWTKGSPQIHEEDWPGASSPPSTPVKGFRSYGPGSAGLRAEAATAALWE